MTAQLHFEDFEVGADIPPLSKVATTAMLVRWAGAAGDFYPLHYDSVFARDHGVNAPVVHGELKRAWMVQFLTDWIGEEGFLKTFACQYLKIDHPRNMKTSQEPLDGDTWWCKGRVTRKYEQSGAHCADCDFWLETAKGEQTLKGTATMILPSKSD